MTNSMAEDHGIKTREDLIDALYEAAELEHSLCCLYLFAAFSLKRDPEEGNVTWVQIEKMREWESSIFLVARQEMAHLGYVCNLLTAIGGAPHLRRPNFPTKYFGGKFPFDLEAFSLKTIAKFICYERPHKDSFEQNHEYLRFANVPPAYDTIGELYTKIQKGFETLVQKKESLFIGPDSAQIESQDFPGFYNRPGMYQIEIYKVFDLDSARRAIKQIIEEGEGPKREKPSEECEESYHYQRFLCIFEELKDMEQDSQFQPARPVVDNPVVLPDDAGLPDGSTRITHPATKATLDLFNAAYEIMMLLLIRIFSHIDETESDVLALQKIAFFPMMTMVIRPLGEVLTQMPAFEPDTGHTAGPNFEVARDLTLLPHKQTAWIYLHERFQELAKDCNGVNHQLNTLSEDLQERIRPRLCQLQKNLDVLAVNFFRQLNLQEKS
jgi:hypothetical protein